MYLIKESYVDSPISTLFNLILQNSVIFLEFGISFNAKIKHLILRKKFGLSNSIIF